jgi:pimeloyl-ACP methyl ester carboxylesterase
MAAGSPEFDPRAVRRAVLREAGALLVQGLLYPFGRKAAPPRPERRPDIRTVVLVHGLGANRGIFYPLQWYLRRFGHRRIRAINLGRARSVQALSLRLKRDLDATVKGGRIAIVAHSLGGLVARHYVQALGGARRVELLITLGTPHLGTHASTFIPTHLLHQLRPDSRFIQELNALPWPEETGLYCIGGDEDICVLPREAALLPGAAGGLLPGVGHHGLLLSPRAFARVAEALAAVRPDPRGSLSPHTPPPSDPATGRA